MSGSACRNVVLVGFSAAGKSSVLRELAVLGFGQAVDLDSEIERRSGRTISELFRVEGEVGFRKIETQLLNELLSSGASDASSLGFQPPLVIAAGGGVLGEAANRKLLVSDSVVLVHLAVSAEVAASRLVKAGEAHRPLLQGGGDEYSAVLGRVAELMEKRARQYDLASVKVWSDWADAKSVAGAVVSGVGESVSGRIVLIPVGALGVPLTFMIGSGLSEREGRAVLSWKRFSRSKGFFEDLVNYSATECGKSDSITELVLDVDSLSTLPEQRVVSLLSGEAGTATSGLGVGFGSKGSENFSDRSELLLAALEHALCSSLRSAER